jgi:hypothetical protein
MPHLQHLSLSYIIIGTNLLNLLISHAPMIRSLRLSNAYVLDDVGDTWANFFGKLAHADPPFTELREFEMDWGKRYGAHYSPYEGSEQIFRLVYIVTSSKYGTIEVVEDREKEKASADMKAYQEFLHIVESNWEKE